MRPMLSLLLAAVGTSIFAADWPTKTLSNDTVTMTIRLPDAKLGFYRGTRFDWLGVIGPVELLGKKVFLPWKDTHNPENNDDITGPCDEFGMHSPLGFAEAKEGGRFVKIGVGELTKGKDPEYAFWKKYEIASPAESTFREKPGAILFMQKYSGNLGYGYDYAKTIELTATGFILDFKLINTGRKTIDTDVYNHNFFNVAGASTGAGFRVTYPFAVRPLKPAERFQELTRVADKSIALTGPLDQGSIYTLVEGYDQSPDHAKFAIEGGGLRMNVTGNRPLSKVALWGVKTTLCPEPYIAVRLAPGESMAWRWTYAFDVVK